MMYQDLKRLQKDLHSFHESWEMISNKEELIEDVDVLTKIAEEIQTLHQDILHLTSNDAVKENSEIIDYMLQSPWGAPFVYQKPLLDAAASFKHAKTQDLHNLLHEFLQYKQEINEQLFDWIQEVETNLNKNNEQ